MNQQNNIFNIKNQRCFEFTKWISPKHIRRITYYKKQSLFKKLSTHNLTCWNISADSFDWLKCIIKQYTRLLHLLLFNFLQQSTQKYQDSTASTILSFPNKIVHASSKLKWENSTYNFSEDHVMIKK